MTNGEPLVVRGAMKPIPTLTKPLRSVDTETKEPAQALRERTDSTVVRPRAWSARRWSRSCWPRCYREKFGGDHIDDVLARARRLQGAHRLERARKPSPQRAALVFVGFMGAGKSTGARAPLAALGVRGDRLRRAARAARSASRSRSSSTRDGEERVPRARGGGRRSSCWSAPTAARSRSAAARRLRAGPRARSAATPSSGCEVDARRRLAAGRAAATGRWRATASASTRLLAERAPLYEALADAVLLDRRERDDRRPRAAGARARCASCRPATQLLWAAQRVGRVPGVRRRAGCSTAGCRGRCDGRRFCVTDATRRRALRRRGSARVDRHVIEVAPGERPKTLAEAERVLRELAARRDRPATTTSSRSAAAWSATSPGFCAAIYQRGVPVVQVPTTLVAQVDSAYGGKTGVDLPEGKNYVGAYHQPRAVLADPRDARDAAAGGARRRLRRGGQDRADRRRRRCGSACARSRRSTPASSRRSSSPARATKLEVVAADERDAGRRQVLNLGHTVGHAIEAATGYARYRHGEAVGLGLLAALRLSGAARAARGGGASCSTAPACRRALDPASTSTRSLAALARDKKRTAAGVGFVLVERARRRRAPAQRSSTGDVRARRGGAGAR